MINKRDKMADFKFEIKQVVEMVRGQKEDNYKASIIRRFISDESFIKKFIDDQAQDGDLFEVCERRMKKDANNVEHDLYLCRNLKTDEFTLFGRSGLREHVPVV